MEKQIKLTLEQARKMHIETKDEALTQMLEINFPSLLEKEYIPTSLAELSKKHNTNGKLFNFVGWGNDLFQPIMSSLSGYIQLAILMEDYRQQIDWVPDFNDEREYKWAIIAYSSRIRIEKLIRRYGSFCFKTREHAELFLETNKEIIKQYFGI